MGAAPGGASAGQAVAATGDLKLFGYDPVPVRMEVIPRSRAWRLRRTVVAAGALLLVTPLVALAPPHAPWAAAGLLGAVVLGRRRWTERWSVGRFQAPCPRCGRALSLAPGTRLRAPQAVPCDGCGHEPLLEVRLG